MINYKVNSQDKTDCTNKLDRENLRNRKRQVNENLTLIFQCGRKYTLMKRL